MKYGGKGNIEEVPGFTWGIREGFLEWVILVQVLDSQLIQVSWEREGTF